MSPLIHSLRLAYILFSQSQVFSNRNHLSFSWYTFLFMCKNNGRWSDVGTSSTCTPVDENSWHHSLFVKPLSNLFCIHLYFPLDFSHVNFSLMKPKLSKPKSATVFVKPCIRLSGCSFPPLFFVVHIISLKSHIIHHGGFDFAANILNRFQDSHLISLFG